MRCMHSPSASRDRAASMKGRGGRFKRPSDLPGGHLYYGSAGTSGGAGGRMKGMDVLVVVAKSLLVLVLSSFVVVTAFSFLRVRVKKKEAQFRNIIKLFGLA